MSRPSSVALLAAALTLVGCSKVADLVGVPGGVATVTVVAPATILVGDTVLATVLVKNSRGQTVDAPATWRSSDASAISVDAMGRLHSDAIGRQATISATVGGKTGSTVISVGDDQRLGYALADQPAAAGPYSPPPDFRFNSSGGAISITHGSVGLYSVRFAGLGRTSGQRDNVQVTGYGGAQGTFCKLGGWQSAGSDMLADVRCFSVAGAPADSRFTILLSGARVYIPTSRLGFVLSPDFTGNISLDTAGTVRNNSSRTVVSLSHTSLGEYNLQFPGLERVAGPGQGPETLQITAVGSGPERCNINAMDPSIAAVNVLCTTTGGAPADSRFSLLLFQRGRPQPFRFAYAYANMPTSSVDYTPNTAFWRNNSGGTITARQLATGRYRIVFEGQAKTAGATETILITPIFSANRICTTTSWNNTGASDLEVLLSCFDPAGALASAQFNILMVQ
jgi:hypothetical protein